MKNLEKGIVYFMHVYQSFFISKNKRKLFLVAKSSGPLLAGLPLNTSFKSRLITQNLSNLTNNA